MPEIDIEIFNNNNETVADILIDSDEEFYLSALNKEKLSSLR